MPTVFGEHNGPPSRESSAEHRLKEWSALMSMQDLSSFTIRELPQPSRTATVDPGLAMQMLDDESVFLKAFADFAESLPPDLRRGFFNCIALVGASLPIETLHADMAGTAEQIVPDRVDEDTLAQAVQATLSVLLGARKDIKEIKSLMKDVDPFRSAWEDTERIIAATIETKEDT